MRDNYQTSDKENSEIQRVGVSEEFKELENGTLTSSVVGKKSIGSGYTLALTDSCKSTMSADESRFDKNGDVNQPSSCHQRTQIVYGSGQFDFLSGSLPILRRIDRNVNLEEMSNVKFVCPGSNSHIFSAIWRNQSVIVKTLQQSKVHCALAVSELNIELDLLSRIDHPNIIKILGAGVSPKPFIILERLQDVSQLFNHDRPQLFRRHPFTFLGVLQIAKDFADALQYLHHNVHDNGMIIHRDLKPENLGLTANGSLKLFDFGLCRCVRKRTLDDQVYKMTGNTGSLRFMAPEVVLGKPYTEKVDVYSFAIVFWTIARNEEPFAGFDVASHKQRVAIGGERPKLKKSWPDDFKCLLTECWDPDGTRRPDFRQISNRLSKIILKHKKIMEGRPMIKNIMRSLSISSFGTIKAATI